MVLTQVNMGPLMQGGGQAQPGRGGALQQKSEQIRQRAGATTTGRVIGSCGIFPFFIFSKSATRGLLKAMLEGRGDVTGQSGEDRSRPQSRL